MPEDFAEYGRIIRHGPIPSGEQFAARRQPPAARHTVAMVGPAGTRVGPVLAYRLVKETQPQASLNLLWALAAGLLDVDWRELSDQEKDKLRNEIGEV